MNKCKVCKKNINQSGPGRPRLTHERCKNGKKGTIRRYSSGSTTVSRKGKDFAGVGRGWVILYHGGRTGDTQHDKTWAVKLVKKGSGWAVVTRHGRRTGEKNETVRRTMPLSEAQAAAERLIKSKLRKGYQYAGSQGPARKKSRRRK